VIAALLLLSALAADPQTPPPPANPAVKLSRGERKERTAKLPAAYQQFLLDVEPIMQPAELDTFLILESDGQRDLYIDDFWKRRDQAQGLSSGAFRKTYYDRIATAKQRYGSMSSDRSRAYLVHGEPAAILNSDTCELLQPLQVWTFIALPGFEREATFLFYQPRDGVSYVLWSPYSLEPDALYDLISRSVVGTEQGKAAAIERVFGRLHRGAMINHLQFECRNGEEIMQAITTSQSRQQGSAKVFVPAPVDPEQVRKILRSVVVPTKDAKKLPTELTVAYPGKQNERTVAEITVLVPKAQLAIKEVSGAKMYSLDVTGEVLKNDQLFENYRYRFDYLADVKTEQVAVVVDRVLRPGKYLARLRISDINANTEAIVEQELDIPEMTATPEEQKERKESTATLQTIKDQIESNRPTLRISPLGDAMAVGLQHNETVVAGEKRSDERIASVEFFLDGRKIMTKRTRPFMLDLDFGPVPQLHKVRAVGYNADGQMVSGDEVTLNSGNDPFRVRIVSPRVAPRVSGPTRVEMAVDIPEGKTLDKLELFYNDTRVATLFQPPFVQVVDVTGQEAIGYLRAVASLKDSDQPTIEDVVMINTPQFMEEVNVHLVELPTTVLRDGRPVTDLQQPAFSVLDDGKPVKIAKFEHVTNLPLSLGLAIDTSGSMRPRIGEAQKAAAQFLGTTLRKGDRAFLVSFDSQPLLIQRWSPDLADLNTALAKLRPDESTALYDAVVFALYNFVNVKGQKALVLITDGKDTSSKFSFDQALEYAKRSGLPIYAVGIGIAPTEVDTRYKLGKFCGETGGNVYFIDRAEDLQRIYTDIQNELRSQYVLGFYPADGIKPGSKWHEVAVQVNGGKAKTIRGYYP
jgi:Ca-activated chloride channel family protein